MHAEIERTQQALEDVIAQQLTRMKLLSRRELLDLQHEAQDLGWTRQGTVRIASQMTATICEALL